MKMNVYKIIISGTTIYARAEYMKEVYDLAHGDFVYRFYVAGHETLCINYEDATVEKIGEFIGER